jgi:raffinose/stachyose/melibiose transport system permease protein
VAPVRRRHRAPAAHGVLFLLPALVVVALFTLYPLVDILRLSLYRWDGYGPQHFIGLGNLRALAADSAFRLALDHSLQWIVLAVILPTVLGLGLALLFARSRLGGLATTILLFPALLPPSIVGAIWLLLLSPTVGILGATGIDRAPLGDPHGAFVALFAAWLWSQIGVSVILFRAGLRAIGNEFHEIARMEGAGAIWRFRHVTLPALRRTLGGTLLVNGVLAGAVFDLVYVTTGGGPGDATTVLPLDMYNRAFGGRTGEGAAVATIQVLLILAVALVALPLLSTDHSFAGGEPEVTRTARRPRAAGLGAIAVGMVSLLPLLWLARALALPGRALSLGTAGPSLGAVGTNVQAAFTQGLGGALLTSLGLAGAVTAGTLLLAAPAAYGLADGVRSRTVRAGTVATLALAALSPAPVVIIPLFTLLHRLGGLNTAWGIALPEIAQALPLAVLAIWLSLRGTGREPIEAARVDGASPLQCMVYIALPLARPGLAVAALWAFVTSWNQYLLPTVVSQDGSLATVPTVLAGFAGAYDTQLGALAASTTIGVLPTLLLYLALARLSGAGVRRMWETLR